MWKAQGPRVETSLNTYILGVQFHYTYPLYIPNASKCWMHGVFPKIHPKIGPKFGEKA